MLQQPAPDGARRLLVEADVDALAHHIWACIHGHVLLQLLRGVTTEDGPARAGYDRDVGWLLAGVSASPR